MRVLIVDDDEWKTQAILEELCRHGIARSDIVGAKSSAEARQLLLGGSFELMFMDVILPARNGSQPSGEISIELLRQIVEDGTSPAPRHIVGVTADPDALQLHTSEFKRMTFHLLHIAPAIEEWRGYIQQLIAFDARSREAEGNFDFDVCVLNALLTPELEAVRMHWPVILNTEQILDGSVLYRSGTLELDGQTKRVVTAYPAQMGPIAAVQAADSLIHAFKPRVLLMTGVCGGFSDHVGVGDVVVAERSWDWQAGKWTGGNHLQPAPDQRSASISLLTQARALPPSEIVAISTQFAANRPAGTPKLVVGPMVTGSAVVASTEIQGVFRGQHRKMVAIDMECYGLYFAAAMATSPRPEVLCIKAVSDLADRGKSDDFQRYCSYMSAMVGLRVLNRHFSK